MCSFVAITSTTAARRESDLRAKVTIAALRRGLVLFVVLAGAHPSETAPLNFRVPHPCRRHGCGFSLSAPDSPPLSHQPPLTLCFFVRPRLYPLRTCTTVLSSVVRQNDAHRGRTMYVARQPGHNSICGGTGAPACGRREAGALSLALLSSCLISPISHRHTFHVCPSVSADSVRLPSVPSVVMFRLSAFASAVASAFASRSVTSPAHRPQRLPVLRLSRFSP